MAEANSEDTGKVDITIPLNKGDYTQIPTTELQMIFVARGHLVLESRRKQLDTLLHRFKGASLQPSTFSAVNQELLFLEIYSKLEYGRELWRDVSTALGLPQHELQFSSDMPPIDVDTGE